MSVNTGKKILVTGGTGLLAKGFVETAPKDTEIICLHLRDYQVNDSLATHLSLDIRQKNLIDALFLKHKFDVVIHAAGIASVDYVETNYAESLESNIVGTLNITAACRKSGTYMVYVSTNAVFDGLTPPYSENSTVGPINKYGRIKLECERLVQETLENYCIFRPILMYGCNHPMGRVNPATWLLKQLRAGEIVHMVNDIYENPVYNGQCGEALWKVVQKKPLGIFHIGGGEIVNRYEFAIQLAEVAGLDKSLIQPVDSSYFTTIAERPRNTSFITDRMKQELGVKPLTIKEGFKLMLNIEGGGY